MKRTLDLGCGLQPSNIFRAEEVYGIDIRGESSEFIGIADLAVESMPHQSDYFDYVTAFDFIEHIPRVIYAPERRNPFVELMNEIHRVLKMGGLFFSVTPAFPHPSAFQDPTHVNIITENTFPLYFDDKNREAKIYGFTGAFRVVQQEWRDQHLAALLQKVPVDGSAVVPLPTWRIG